jgi:hypothetical protein
MEYEAQMNFPEGVLRIRWSSGTIANNNRPALRKRGNNTGKLVEQKSH